MRDLAAKAKSPAVQRDYRELAYEWDIMAEQIADRNAPPRFPKASRLGCVGYARVDILRGLVELSRNATERVL